MKRLFTSMNTSIVRLKTASIQFDKSPRARQPSISDSETLEALKHASHVLQTTHEPVAFPTETVYGLGASALSTESVKSIYAAKNRPADNPLIVHVSSLDQLKRKILKGREIPDVYTPLIEKFWPGPLTILLPLDSDSDVSPACTVGQPTVAVRMPDHPVARSLIALSDLPLAAPSANASTRPSPTTADHVYHDLQGRIPLILDGGACHVGVESTVVDGLSDPPMLLRPGGVSLEQIREHGGEKWKNVLVGRANAKTDEAVRTPGMKYKHYSPTGKVVLFGPVSDKSVEQAVKEYVTSGELEGKKIGLLTSLTLSNDTLPDVHTLSMGTTPALVSRNLFAGLRDMDIAEVEVILVEGIREEDEGLAVMNRLRKAASEEITV
ncbi:DHBP synthase RibB-like alpha/beta domain-containing protein [Yarrowia lipolytica]|nr:DHBP synthase RibB-like alpha/beta domain-containing protein [Yarrowia lipolytica]RDW34622.1 DHBP synthase RibB-like alpha/beta domain-containing protein [Yarrowia lipolytica]RDW40184.1 DHBP synthase RibB-like alpha/beta domain-containing protein [Yarrowia lipolytica]RDW43750.1 DHBP synthase RibB-like alpha/beta domain-containing protein [Yarrowia lipolytica]RDW50474.1 DHBP synthase RibB-like alpha/beta domain-containing protein [Yarrowia lipolytica]